MIARSAQKMHAIGHLQLKGEICASKKLNIAKEKKKIVWEKKK